MKVKYSKLNNEINSPSAHRLSGNKSWMSRNKHKVAILVTLQIVGLFMIYSLTSSSSFNKTYDSPISSPPGPSDIYKRTPGVKVVFGSNLLYHLPNWIDTDLKSHYKAIEESHSILCFLNGTDWEAVTLLRSLKRCICIDGYYGSDCGIPNIIWSSDLFYNGKENDVLIERRSRPRRILISVLLDCHSRAKCVDFVNAMLRDLSGTVDLFILTEILHPLLSTNTNRSQTINDALENGKLNKYSDLVIYSSITVKERRSDLVREGIRQLWESSFFKVVDFRSDDIIVVMSPNSYPIRNVMQFFRFYDGFSEPFKLLISNTNCNHSSGLAEIITKFNQGNYFNMGISFEFASMLCRFDFDTFQSSLCLDNDILLEKFTTNFRPISTWMIGGPTSNESAVKLNSND